MRRVTRSATTRSTAAKPIRKGHHVIDQALAVAEAIHRGDPTPGELRARRRELRNRYGSRGRIHILEQLGQAIRELTPFEIEVYRSPRVTWKLVQRIVRKGATRAELIQSFRSAIALPPIDRRRRRRRPTPPGLSGTYSFDPQAALDDPISYLAAALDAWLSAVGTPFRTAINQQSARAVQGMGVMDVGQSLSMLMASLTTRPGATANPAPVLPPDHALVLRMLKRVDEIRLTLQQTASLSAKHQGS